MPLIANRIPPSVQRFLDRCPVEQLPPKQRAAGVTAEDLRRAAMTVHAQGDPLQDGHVMRVALELVERGRRQKIAAGIWTEIQPELRQRLYESAWRMWIEPLEPVDLLDGVLVLTAPDAIRTWVERRYLDVILEQLASVPDVIGVRFQ